MISVTISLSTLSEFVCCTIVRDGNAISSKDAQHEGDAERDNWSFELL